MTEDDSHVRFPNKEIPQFKFPWDDPWAYLYINDSEGLSWVSEAMAVSPDFLSLPREEQDLLLSLVDCSLNRNAS